MTLLSERLAQAVRGVGGRRGSYLSLIEELDRDTDCGCHRCGWACVVALVLVRRDPVESSLEI